MASARWDRKKTRTRQGLLEAGLEVFALRGLYSPSIEDITEAADVGKGTFYQYFSSREDLVAALVRQSFSAILEEARRSAGPPGAEEVPKRLLEAHGRFFRDHPRELVLLHQARGWMKLPNSKSGPVRDEFERYIKELGTILKPCLEGMKMPARHRRRAALAFAGFAFGVLSFEFLLGGGAAVLADLPGDGAVLSLLLRT